MRANPPTVFLVACLASAACAELDSDDNVDPGPASDPIAAASAELAGADLPALFARTRRALVEYEGGLRGGDATAGVEVSDRGVALTPYRWDAAFTADEPGAPLALRTASITRGMRALHDHALVPAPMRTVDGAAELDHGGAVEVIRVVDRGAEQAWRFDTEPAPDLRDDLVVRVAVAGQVYAGRTAGGLHFVDPATGLGFAYSDGVWIDARGERHPVPAVLDAATGEITLTVPGDVVRAAAYPAVLDPVVSAELGLDTPILGPSASTQYQPDIAYAEGSYPEYLVVWTDSRRETGFGSDVFGARVDMDGEVLDPTGLNLPIDSTGSQYDPAVAWGDDGPGGTPGHWLVVWTDGKVGNIRGTRVNALGQPLGLDFDVSVPDVSPFESQPDVAFNPIGGTASRFLVAWKSSAGGLQVVSLLPNSPDAGGVALRTISTSASAQTPVIAAGNPDGSFVVAWAATVFGNWDIFSIRVAANLASTGALQLVTTSTLTQLSPAIAFVPGRGYVVVWEDYQAGNADIRGSILATTGAVITTATTGIGTGAGTQMTPAIAVAGTEALVLWVSTTPDTEGNVMGQRVEPLASGVFAFSGSTIGVATLSGLAEAPAVAANAPEGQYLAVWDGRAPSTAGETRPINIYGARVYVGSGTVGDSPPLALGTAYDQQTAPAVAGCGGYHLAVWAGNRGDGRYEIIGTLLDTVEPPNVVVPRIVISTMTVWQGLPAVACSENRFYVAWAADAGPAGSGRNILGALLSNAGAVLLTQYVSTAAGTQTEPSVAHLPEYGVFEVAWADRRSGNYDIWGTRITNAGSLLTTYTANISGAAAGDQIRPDVTSYSEQGMSIYRFYVAWQDGRNLSLAGWDIRGRRISSSGAISADLLINIAAGHQTSPTIAVRPPLPSGGTGVVVVAYETAGAGQDIAATFLGAPGGVQAIAIGPYHETAPDLVHRSDDALILTYQRSVTSPAIDGAVLGRELAVNPGGFYGLGPELLISDDGMYIHAIRESNPAIACASPLRCLVLYQRYADTAIPDWEDPVEAPGVERVRRRTLAY